MKRHVLLTLLFGIVCAVSAHSGVPVKFTVVAFGGKVTILDHDGQLLRPAKGIAIPIGSRISTSDNSWIDLSQGGLSVLRVKSGTESLVIDESSLDKESGQSTTVFKLRNGSVFARVNKKALKKGSKYQVQMPELIAGVFGSQCEAGSGPIGSSIYNVKGNIGGSIINKKGNTIGGERRLAEGEVMFHSNRPDENAGFEPSPIDVKNRLQATSSTIPEPEGDVLNGKPKGGTVEVSVVNAISMMAEAILPAATPGVSPNTPDTLQVPPSIPPESSSLPEDISKVGTLLPPHPTESSPTQP